MIQAVVTDFGGVLTTPLLHAFTRWSDERSVPLEALGKAMAQVAVDEGVHPLHELETGRWSEEQFLRVLGRAVSAELGREVPMERFGEAYFAGLEPNEELFAFYRGLHERGMRMAILTNNVREWESLWRAMLPVDVVFDVIVDSGFVGLRKPDERIYALTLGRLGLPAASCVFVDDIEENVEAAAALGFHAVHFRETAQAVRDVRAVLGREGWAGAGAAEAP